MNRWREVAERVQTRRLELGLTQTAAVARANGGVSLAVWNNLERAAQESYRPSSLAAVCRALGWRVDSIDRIRKGEDPVAATEPSNVIVAIENDPLLNEEDKRYLLGAYKTLVADRADERQSGA